MSVLFMVRYGLYHSGHVCWQFQTKQCMWMRAYISLCVSAMSCTGTADNKNA